MQYSRRSSLATWAYIVAIVWFVAGIVAVAVVERNQIVGNPPQHKTLVALIIGAWVVGLVVFLLVGWLSSRGEGRAAHRDDY